MTSSTIITSEMDKNIVTDQEISSLIGHFAKETFKCSNNSDFSDKVNEKCLNLLQLDYTFLLIDNSKGRINDQYPSKIPVLQHELFSSGSKISSSSFDDISQKGAAFQRRNSLGAPSTTIHSSPEPFVRSQSVKMYRPKNHNDTVTTDILSINALINEAKFARCRNRFVIPVIMYEGKYICRSSTIARMTEIGLGTTTEKGLSFEELGQLDNKRKCDVELLKAWKVGTIIDLMVENEKQKYLISLTSSEKIDDTKKYSVFRIIPTPYPGCEFFLDFKKNNYNSEGLMFDWSDPLINSTLNVKPNPAIDQLNIQWSKYKTWDLRQLTENYLSLMLKYVWCSSKGILIHCISGWDRTPMFISLLRMSLWADGVIHKSLSPSQILYLTLAYDWYLFGHNLKNRLEKGEDIMHFCFHFLKYIYSDIFKTQSASSAATPPSSPIYCSNGNEFDFSDLDNLVIHSRNDDNDINSHIKIDDLTNGKSYDSLDDCYSQLDIKQNTANKLKSIKKLAEKFSVEETMYEMDDVLMPDKLERKQHKCSSNINRTLPVDILTSQQKTRTYSSSSESDEWSVVTQTGSLNENELSENQLRSISSREIRLSAVRELFHKCYSAHGYKTDCHESIISKLLF